MARAAASDTTGMQAGSKSWRFLLHCLQVWMETKGGFLMGRQRSRRKMVRRRGTRFFDRETCHCPHCNARLRHFEGSTYGVTQARCKQCLRGFETGLVGWARMGFLKKLWALTWQVLKGLLAALVLAGVAGAALQLLTTQEIAKFALIFFGIAPLWAVAPLLRDIVRYHRLKKAPL